ncbi:hypothetical protein LJK87_47865 [Paenibacillus sp. P25]|nr:hypothetical protein LJK87_47865 [Paenibacillus sp. P25]
MDDLKRINQELGITTIVNLHFIDLAREYATRIIGLRAGKLVFDGPVSEATDDKFSEIYGRAIKKDELLGGTSDEVRFPVQAGTAEEAGPYQNVFDGDFPDPAIMGERL